MTKKEKQSIDNWLIFLKELREISKEKDDFLMDYISIVEVFERYLKVLIK